MALTNTILTNTGRAIFTSNPIAPQEGHAITCMIICNTTVDNAVVSIYAVPMGSTAGVANQIVNALPVPAGETVSLDQEKIVLSTGDSIWASSDISSKLTFTVSYIPV